MKKILNHLDRAEQIVRVVYPLAHDPKVLLDALKELEKTVPYILQIRPRLERQDEMLLQEIQNLLEKHVKAPVEFSRDRKFVMCSPKYDLTQISASKVSEYVKQFKRLCNDERNL